MENINLKGKTLLSLKIETVCGSEIRSRFDVQFNGIWPRTPKTPKQRENA